MSMIRIEQMKNHEGREEHEDVRISVLLTLRQNPYKCIPAKQNLRR